MNINGTDILLIGIMFMLLIISLIIDIVKRKLNTTNEILDNLIKKEENNYVTIDNKSMDIINQKA